MKANELLRLACIYAEQDRQAFIDAYDHMKDDPEYAKTKKFLEELRAYRKKRWGATALETMLAGARSCSINTIRNKEPGK